MLNVCLLMLALLFSVSDEVPLKKLNLITHDKKGNYQCRAKVSHKKPTR